MPRSLNKGPCNTCLQRNLKCDEATPVCGTCIKTSRACERVERQVKFREYAASFHQGDGALNRFNPPQDPRRTLNDQKIASLFEHYITDLSKWYDLSDEVRTFGINLPEYSLEIPLLFCAIIALSAMHVSKTANPNMRPTAEFYHGCCVRLLVSLEEGDELISTGSVQATTCLLRSYEVLEGLIASMEPDVHLRGAYSMMSFHSLLSIVPQSPLVAASFWNHLREDITFSLIEVRPLILDLEIVSFDITTRNSDHDYLNTLSIILGKIINVAFDHSMSVDEWKEAYYMLGKWAMGLPVQLKPFSKAHAISGMGQTFPSVRFLQPYHAATMHYYLIALTILAEQAPPGNQSLLTGLDPLEYDESCFQMDTAQLWALEICGVVFTSKTPAVIVNAFGPIAYCGRYIRTESNQEELIRQLAACKDSVGWPVQRLITNLQMSWVSR